MADKEWRDPRDLKGLLKFCMEATKAEDASKANASEEMDPERKRWLKEALDNLSVDVIQQLTEGIRLLSQPHLFDPETPQEELDRVEDQVFGAIEDWIGNIDMANNFEKLGGLRVLKKCLTSSPHATVRSNAANLIAELAQNNPYCQDRLLRENVFEDLLNMLEKDEDEGCKLKALYAVSSMVRSHGASAEQFLQLKGPETVLRVGVRESGSSKRLRTKACFFVSAVCSNGDAEDVKRAFAAIGTARQLSLLLQQEEHDQSHEHMARALLSLLQGDQEAATQCLTSPELNMMVFLKERKALLEGKEEFFEELQYIQDMERLCRK